MDGSVQNAVNALAASRFVDDLHGQLPADDAGREAALVAVLELMTSAEQDGFCKALRLDAGDASRRPRGATPADRKSARASGILSALRQQGALPFGGKSRLQLALERAARIVGASIRLAEEAEGVFTRTQHLFYMFTASPGDGASGALR